MRKLSAGKAHMEVVGWVGVWFEGDFEYFRQETDWGEAHMEVVEKILRDEYEYALIWGGFGMISRPTWK